MNAVKMIRGAELPFVDQIFGELIIAVEPDGKARKNHLVDPDIEIMRPLRPDGVVLLHSWSVRRVVEERNCSWCDELERRGDEIA